ncbi:hypothetical protein PAGU2196_04590 [Pseudomonas sp. PAGU 2196]|uniref:MarR family winged helix-turn-helix transcriptional regulator n=1 Tax=Pseudomonas sp. PAGU 2196 TaxID=2793997 RepID=UPI001EDE7A38|nr:MarR family transcriptional regulator [Pseudomonas sp. PAGU 2196]GHS79625.1 hypothetical protein PAGU2196_04590 [Pseudomonas sp. PAGU 2196]
MASNAEPVLRSLFCFNFYRGWRGISEFYRRYLPEGISAQQSYLLELCKTNEGILVGEIAHQLEIEMSAVSGLLKRMEVSGLVRREVAPQNRRQTLVYLTDEGEQLRSQVHTAMVVADKQLSKAIPKEDKVALMKVVDQIRVLIGEDG